MLTSPWHDLIPNYQRGRDALFFFLLLHNTSTVIFVEKAQRLCCFATLKELQYKSWFHLIYRTIAASDAASILDSRLYGHLWQYESDR